MIKEFWQERREEKKRQKQLKKENKKAPKTKEQIAYKVFGILFTLFLIFGSIGYACNTIGGFGDLDGYSWDSLYGVTDEMKDALTAPVDRNIVLNECVIGGSDWQDAIDALATYNIVITKDGQLDIENLGNIELTENVELENMSLGALVAQFMGSVSSDDDSELLSFKLYLDGDDLYLKTVCLVDLSSVVIGSKLPIVYVTTMSRLRIMGGKLQSVSPQFKINQIEETLNEEILSVISKSIFTGSNIDSYTNACVANWIEFFAELIGTKTSIVDDGIVFEVN